MHTSHRAPLLSILHDACRLLIVRIHATMSYTKPTSASHTSVLLSLLRTCCGKGGMATQACAVLDEHPCVSEINSRSRAHARFQTTGDTMHACICIHTLRVSAVSPDWLTKTHMSSRKIGARRSNRSEASSSETCNFSHSHTSHSQHWCTKATAAAFHHMHHHGVLHQHAWPRRITTNGTTCLCLLADGNGVMGGINSA